MSQKIKSSIHMNLLKLAQEIEDLEGSFNPLSLRDKSDIKMEQINGTLLNMMRATRELRAELESPGAFPI